MTYTTSNAELRTLNAEREESEVGRVIPNAPGGGLRIIRPTLRFRIGGHAFNVQRWVSKVGRDRRAGRGLRFFVCVIPGFRVSHLCLYRTARPAVAPYLEKMNSN